MERKLVSIQVIKDIKPIPNADNIELVYILGWQCVSKKGNFKVGDFCLYFEVDALLPEHPEFEFMRNKKFRVKTIKLRGMLSQGLALPIDVLDKVATIEVPPGQRLLLKEGDDVSSLLNVKKYEPPESSDGARLGGKAVSNFPPFLHKTDEIRIQSVPDVLARHNGKAFYITEKLDGSSMTMYLCNGKFGVCSRNFDIDEEDGNSFWEVARKGDWETKLRTIASMLGTTNVAVQGEMVGAGVQKNKYRMTGRDIYIFNIYDINDHKFLSFAQMVDICVALDVKMVPIVTDYFEMSDMRVDDMIAMADGQSLLNDQVIREGIIFRPLAEDFDPELGRLSFKVISNHFLLKHDE
jgi:RNA ligase (TIGR02306 family)